MPIFRKDPCGIICLVITYVAVFYADYVVVRWIIIQTMHTRLASVDVDTTDRRALARKSNIRLLLSLYFSLWGPLHMILFNTIILLLTMSHLRAVFSDPGLVPLPHSRLDFSDINSGSQKENSREDWTVCARCETYRPPRAHHCRICKRCVRRMDHHCPWINNCVGEWNQKYFLQFLVYVGLLSVYAVALVVASWMGECQDCSKDRHITQTRILHSVVLVVESGLFGLFVTAIMCDQLQAVFTDETAVEQAKQQGPFRPRRPRMALLAEVCGRSSPMLWLLPCQQAPRDLEHFSYYDV